MVEWSITPVLKTGVLRGTGGSNPSLSAKPADYFSGFLFFKKFSISISVCFIIFAVLTPGLLSAFECVTLGRAAYYPAQGVDDKQILRGIAKFAIAVAEIEIDHAIVAVGPHHWPFSVAHYVF